MTGRFRNKYRIASARATWWDYSNPGMYFITLCAYRHECLFGQIHRRAFLRESPVGGIVLQEWNKSFDMRNELLCDAFVLMPNHLHAILRIDQSTTIRADVNVETHGHVETHGRASLQAVNPHVGGDISPRVVKPGLGVAYRPPKSISSFVAGFKSAATKKINMLRNTPGAAVWQPRFHDHIINNMTDYQRIADYIEKNPANWSDDRFWVATAT